MPSLTPPVSESLSTLGALKPNPGTLRQANGSCFPFGESSPWMVETVEAVGTWEGAGLYLKDAPEGRTCEKEEGWSLGVNFGTLGRRGLCLTPRRERARSGGGGQEEQAEEDDARREGRRKEAIVGD